MAAFATDSRADEWFCLRLGKKIDWYTKSELWVGTTIIYQYDLDTIKQVDTGWRFTLRGKVAGQRVKLNHYRIQSSLDDQGQPGGGI